MKQAKMDTRPERLQVKNNNLCAGIKKFADALIQYFAICKLLLMGSK